MKANISRIVLAMALLTSTMSVSAFTLEAVSEANVVVNAEYRSGDPSAEVNGEVFYNSIKFSPVSGVESYNINRDYATVAVLKESSEGVYTVFTADANGEFTVNSGEVNEVDGVISYVDAVSDISVRPGEGSLDVMGDMVMYAYSVTMQGGARSYDSREYEVAYQGYTAELAMNLHIGDIRYVGNTMSVMLQWINDAASEGSVYEIYRNGGSGWEKVGETDSDSYVDGYQGLESAKVSYYIKAIDSMGEYNSRVLAVNYAAQQNGVITGIEDIDADESGLTINVYPNPATDYVMVEGAAGTITLYGMNGAAALSMPVAEGEAVTIDVTGLTKGLYVLRTGNVSEKILIK